MRTHLALLTAALTAALCSCAQAQPEDPSSAPFALSLQPVSWTGMPGLQSYAHGEHGGQWLLIGGRLDGLHRRQPWASFDLAGHNDRAWVVDPATGQAWSAALDGLPSAVAEQFSATNINHAQAGSRLYLVGGYGYSATAGDHITHPVLSEVDLPGFMAAVREGTDLAPHVRHVVDQDMAVTGGQLAERDGTFYLAGGQRFDGLYNPMGHPTHVQTYTNAIRRFRVSDAGALAVTWRPAWEDSTVLHRRDYNLAPALFPDGRYGWTMYTGVFQYAADLPWLSVVDLDSAGFAERPGFTQYLSHYHSANATFHSAAEGALHTLFFGGIAEYTLDAGGNLVQDTDVPFVSTISRVTRSPDGTTAEYALPVAMPGLLGAGAVFFPRADLPLAAPGILDLDALRALAGEDSLLLGHVYGGIRSTAPNVFWIDNSGTMSAAEERVFAVWMHPATATGLDLFNPASTATLRLQAYPNPTAEGGPLRLAFELERAAEVRVRAFAPDGAALTDRSLGRLAAGRQDLPLSFDAPFRTGPLILELTAGKDTAVQVVIVQP